MKIYLAGGGRIKNNNAKVLFTFFNIFVPGIKWGAKSNFKYYLKKKVR